MGFILSIILGLIVRAAVVQPVPEVAEVEQPVVEEIVEVKETVEDPEPETPVETPQTPSQSAQEQKPATVPSEPTGPFKSEFGSIKEFEEAHLWICPKDVPAGVWPDKLTPSVAIGVLSSTIYDNRNNAWGQTYSIWNAYRSGQVTIPVRVVANIEEVGLHVPKSCDGYLGYQFLNGHLASYSGWWFKINWPERRIYVEAEEGGSHIEISDKTRADAEDMAEWMTNQLRNLEESYIRRCGDVY